MIIALVILGGIILGLLFILGIEMWARRHNSFRVK